MTTFKLTNTAPTGIVMHVPLGGYYNRAFRALRGLDFDGTRIAGDRVHYIINELGERAAMEITLAAGATIEQATKMAAEGVRDAIRKIDPAFSDFVYAYLQHEGVPNDCFNMVFLDGELRSLAFTHNGVVTA